MGKPLMSPARTRPPLVDLQGEGLHFPGLQVRALRSGRSDPGLAVSMMDFLVSCSYRCRIR